MLIATFAFSGPRQARAQTAPVQWNGIDRVVAFADVHGAYAELLALAARDRDPRRAGPLGGRAARIS